MLIKTQVPPCGWNSYDSYGTTIDEAEAYANLKAFVEKLKPAGYEYFVLDAGWYLKYTFSDLIRLRQEGRF